MNWLRERISGSPPTPEPSHPPGKRSSMIMNLLIMSIFLEETVDPAVEEFISARYPGCQYKVLSELGVY